MDIFFDVNTYIDTLKGLSIFEQILCIILIVALRVWKKRAQANHIRNIVQNEKAITHIEDDAIFDEARKTKKRIKDLLASIKSRLYEGMEEFVYDVSDSASRRISLVRKKRKISIVASKFLDDHYDATKEVLFHVILQETIEWMNDHNIAEVHPTYEEINTSASELRGRVFSEIRSRTGTNLDTRAVEDSILTHELLVGFLESSYSYSQQMRSVRKNFVKEETIKYRVPFSPKMSNLFKRSGK